MLISISDNGKGMYPEEAANLRSKLETRAISNPDSVGGVGLINVHHRIRMKYGEGYGIFSILLWAEEPA